VLAQFFHYKTEINWQGDNILMRSWHGKFLEDVSGLMLLLVEKEAGNVHSVSCAHLICFEKQQGEIIWIMPES
jgi:hypothetical protein